MAMTGRSRSAIYQVLSGLIQDQEAVGEMLSYFPARDVEEPATKELVLAESALLRADLALQRADLTYEMGQVRADVQSESKRIVMWTVGANATVLGVVLAGTGLT